MNRSLFAALCVSASFTAGTSECAPERQNADGSCAGGVDSSALLQSKLQYEEMGEMSEEDEMLNEDGSTEDGEVEMASTEDQMLTEDGSAEDGDVNEEQMEGPVVALPYDGMSCTCSDAFPGWHSIDCHTQILDSDVTTWAKGKGIHFQTYTSIALVTPAALAKVEVYYWSGCSGMSYQVQVSKDGSSWETACSLEASGSGSNTCSSLPDTAVSFVKIIKSAGEKCGRYDPWFRMTGVKLSEAVAKLPYDGMSCESSDAYPGWHGTDCSRELLDSDVTTWNKRKGLHFKQWAKFALAGPAVLSNAKVYSWSGCRCIFTVDTSTDGKSWTPACELAQDKGMSSCDSGFPTSAVSYLRINKPEWTKCGPDNWFRATGVEIWGKPAKAAAAPGALLPLEDMTCECSDSFPGWHGTDCAREILDPDVKTWAKRKGIHFQTWAKIGFDQPTALSKAEIYYWSGLRCLFEVQTSADGSSWQTACKKTGSGGMSTCSDFPSEPVSYLRVYKPASSKCPDPWFRMTGVQVWGS